MGDFSLLPPPPPPSPLHKILKNQNFEKMKEIAGDIIILHMCTKMWGCGVRQTGFFVILGYFLTFNSPKNQNF